jgi:hypothetical protein
MSTMDLSKQEEMLRLKEILMQDWNLGDKK